VSGYEGELRGFAAYSRSVAVGAGGSVRRRMWRERAEWADRVAAEVERLVDENRELRAALERYRAMKDHS
jgi:hypothetical protein